MNEQLPDFDREWRETLKWQPNEEQQRQFQQLYEAIIAGNRQLNLTRITEPSDFWEKHLWDSVVGIAEIGLTNEVNKDRRLNVIDIGTGAGFPGLPIAIACPFWQLTLLDSTLKKIVFVETVVNNLNLNNVKTLTERVEKIGREHLYREVYDLALIRAVSQPSVCAEYSLPLLKVGGIAILYRGHWNDKDSKQLQPVLEKLGSKLESIYKLTTPVSNSVRNCIYLRKISSTPPEFPRSVGVPDRQPL
ncbi:MAG: 16S rRNA (guanine(527)-N(7))-methyltransferase RsmG [Xenococcaceae cyanobacterium]